LGRVRSFVRDGVRVTVPIRTSREVGLGDAVEAVTRAIGIKPCASCRRRAAALNRKVVFRGRGADQRRPVEV
jgi:hypothetical protein